MDPRDPDPPNDPRYDDSAPGAGAGQEPRHEVWYDRGSGGGGEGESEGGPSWEYRDQIGMMTAGGRTLSEVLFHPSETFAGARQWGGIGGPLLYSILMGSIFGWLGYAIGMMTRSMTARFMGALLGEAGLEEDFPIGSPMLLFQGLGLVFAVFFIPLAALIGTFVASLINHVCLIIFGGARNGFESTFRVCAYTAGSIAPLQLIPLCGGMISFFWAIIVSIIGLAQMHQTDTWRAVMAVLLPMILSCCAVIAFGGVLFGALMAASGSP